MSLQKWVRNGWLKPHRTSKAEIADLLGVAERDLADCLVGRLPSRIGLIDPTSLSTNFIIPKNR